MSKRSLEKIWRTHVSNARKTTVVDLNETPAQQRERIRRLEAHPEEWFKHYFPSYAYATPAPFHVEASERVLNSPEWYEVRMWSRELAKSTRTMMEVFYLTLVGHSKPGLDRLRKRYVMLISNSLSNAVRLLTPYRANLTHNQRILHDYDMQECPGSWAEEEFITRSGVAFRALGAGQSPRGTRNEDARPDILLFDDVDTDRDCLNPYIITKKWRWIEEAAIGTRSVSTPTTIIFCGNRIAVDCCVHRASLYADHTDIINIRDAYGVSSWPQKNTEQHIDRVLKQKSYAAQQKEYYNNPIIEGAVFEKVYYKPALALTQYDKLVSYTDPSYKATADYKATVLVGRKGDEYHIIKAFVEQTTTARLLEWHHNLMDMLGGTKCDYYIEDVFLQDTIRTEICEASRKMGRLLSLQSDKRQKLNKYTRIESALEPLNRNGLLYFNEAAKDEPGMMMLAQQFLAFAPGSRAHDDGPDAVEGAIFQLKTDVLTGLGKISFKQHDERDSSGF